MGTSPQDSAQIPSTQSLPPTAELKSQARRLRAALGEMGHKLGHGHSLELVARLWGRRDWNTIHAAASVGPKSQRVPSPHSVPWELGHRVTGRAFGKPFTGRILGMSLLSRTDRVRVTVRTDEPVDMVDFDDFSAERRQFNAIIRVADGRSLRRRSDGEHQLEIDLPGTEADTEGSCQ